MKNLIIVFSLIIVSFIIFYIFTGETKAQLSCLPEDCRGQGQYTIDFSCVNKKITSPGFNCCEEKCVGDPGATDVLNEEIEPLFSFFGYTFAVREGQQIPVLINLVITTFLGIVSVYTLGMGIYQGAVVRARATDPETIAAVQKTVLTLIIGFILSWGFIVIIQVIANLIGLGSLQDLTLVGDGGINIIIGGEK